MNAMNVINDRNERNDRKGIAIAGNLLVDHVKTITSYPKPGMLSSIVDVQTAVGGCVPNTLIDMAVMTNRIPLSAIGRVGDDEAGHYVCARLSQAGIDVSQVKMDSLHATSFSDAMCALDTGERTFFHYRGANAHFCPEDIDLSALHCRHLHIGYLMLLDAFDQPDSECGTVMARFLRNVRAQGIETSIDVASDKSGRFAEVITPSLRYCDYTFMNEIEACAVSNLEPRHPSGQLNIGHIRKTLELFISLGVRKRAVIHCPEAGFCMESDGTWTCVPSFQLPDGYIRGSVGAGDAFTAGCLVALQDGMNAHDMLEFAAAAAAANLSAPDAVSGMKPEQELRLMMTQWRKREI